MARKKDSNGKGKGKSNPAVDAVADNLGVDPAASPDEAALDEAARTGAAAQAAAVDAGDLSVKPAQAAPTVSEPALPTPPGGEAELSKSVEEKVQPAQVPPPKPTKQEQRELKEAQKHDVRQPSPAVAKRFGAFATKFPGAEHLKVYKRQKTGKRALVRDYNFSDLSATQDTETFVAKHLAPLYGPGTYEFTAVDGYGRELEVGETEILEPIAPPVQVQAESGMKDVFQLIINQGRERENQLAALLSRPQKDPVESLKDVMELQETLGGSVKKENEGVVAAMITSQASQTQMMMKVMVEQQSRSEESMKQLLLVLSQPKTDPMMSILLTKLLEDKGSKGDPMPAMPSAPDPLDQIKSIAEVVKLLKPEGDQDSKMLTYLLAKSERDSLSPKEWLEMSKSESGTDDMKKAMENISLLTNTFNSLKNQQDQGGGGAATGFVEAVNSLLSNPNLGNVLGNAIRQKMSNQRIMTQQQGYPAMAPDAELQGIQDTERRTQAVRSHRMNLLQRRNQAEQTLQSEKDALDAEIAMNPRPHQPTVRPDSAFIPLDQRLPPIVTPVPGEQQTPLATEEQEAAVQRTVARTGGKMPTFPPDLGDYVNAFIEAEDDGALVEAVVEMIFYLSTLDDWRQFSETVLQLIQEGNKPFVFKFMQEFFAGLESIQFIDNALTTKVMTALDQHFEMITEHIVKATAEPVEEPEE